MCVKIIISRLYHLMSPYIYYQNILLVRVFKHLSVFFPFYGEGKSKLQKKLCKAEQKFLLWTEEFAPYPKNFPLTLESKIC